MKQRLCNLTSIDGINELLGFDPATELGAFRDAVHQLREAGWVSAHDNPSAALASLIVPIDLIDTGADLVIKANLPGVDPDHIQITVSGSTLVLKGQVPVEAETSGCVYLRRERRAAAFTRSIVLPVGVDADQASAVSANGVLTLTLPKTESARPKVINVTPA